MTNQINYAIVNETLNNIECVTGCIHYAREKLKTYRDGWKREIYMLENETLKRSAKVKMKRI